MKKKITFIIAALSLVIAGALTNNQDVSAAAQYYCAFTGDIQENQPLDGVKSTSYGEGKVYIARSIYRCATIVGSGQYYTGKNSIIKHTSADKIKNVIKCGNHVTNSECETVRTNKAKQVADLIANENIDPCSHARKASDSKAWSTCTDNHFEWYCNSPKCRETTSKPSDIKTDDTDGDDDGGGGGGGGGGGTDTKDDDGGEDGIYDAATELDDVEEGKCLSILPESWCNGSKDGIMEIIKLVVAIMTGAVVAAGTVGIIICGYIWMTARDDASKVATAKRRMLDIVIGILAMVLLYTLANLFIPKSDTQIKKDVSSTMMEKKG